MQQPPALIHVVIERHIAVDMEEAYRRVLLDVRRGAVRADGYVSGETLRDTADPRHHVIISTWRSHLDWDRWAASPERIAVMERMRPALSDDERVTVLEPI